MSKRCSNGHKNGENAAVIKGVKDEHLEVYRETDETTTKGQRRDLIELNFTCEGTNQVEHVPRAQRRAGRPRH
jgi:hypothetical protein